MSEYYSPRPALISNPAQGIVFNYPNKVATTVINTPTTTVFQTKDPVLFSPLTDGLFEKVSNLSYHCTLCYASTISSADLSLQISCTPLLEI